MKKSFLVLVLVMQLLCGDLILEENVSKEHTVTVDGTNLRFYPDSLTINEGDTVKFMWGGEILPHNSVEENGVFDSGEPEREVDYSYTFGFEEAGSYNYFCEPHQAVGMDGVITVVDVEQQEMIVETSGEVEEKSSIPFVEISILTILVLMIFMRVKISGIDEIKD
ncbi:MAG: plastocyanin/azurin family copper-binding protein [Candidatus Poseidoniaceae archaeon]|nr:plastocyanin/azurin family copper-binding protein [Candidatus Poseidoniaceae archaeon]